MSDQSQTVTVHCAYCAWQIRDRAPSERAAGAVTRKLQGQLVEHCEQAHAIELAGPVPDGAPQPPATQPDPVTDLIDQLHVCQEALRRIGTQHTLTQAKKVADDALRGIAPRRAWNRTTR